MCHMYLRYVPSVSTVRAICIYGTCHLYLRYVSYVSTVRVMYLRYVSYVSTARAICIYGTCHMYLRYVASVSTVRTICIYGTCHIYLRYVLHNREILARFPAETRGLSFLQNFQTESGIQPASHLRLNAESPPNIKRPERETDHLISFQSYE